MNEPFTLSKVIESSNLCSRKNTGRNSVSLMKTEACFEIMAYIKSRVNMNISGLQTYNELCQIQRTSAVSKTLVFRWHKKFQDGFINLKDGSRLC